MYVYKVVSNICAKVFKILTAEDVHLERSPIIHLLLSNYSCVQYHSYLCDRPRVGVRGSACLTNCACDNLTSMQYTFSPEPSSLQ